MSATTLPPEQWIRIDSGARPWHLPVLAGMKHYKQPSARLVLLAFMCFSWPDEQGRIQSAAPGFLRVSQFTGLSESTYNHALAALLNSPKEGIPPALRRLSSARKSSPKSAPRHARFALNWKLEDIDPAARPVFEIDSNRPAVEYLNAVSHIPLTHSTREILSLLAVASRDGIEIEISVRDLCDLTGGGPRTIYRSIATLTRPDTYTLDGVEFRRGPLVTKVRAPYAQTPALYRLHLPPEISMPCDKGTPDHGLPIPQAPPPISTAH